MTRTMSEHRPLPLSVLPVTAHSAWLGCGRAVPGNAPDVVRVRTKLGLPQTKFARLLGISEDTLQNWERGRRKPTGPAKVLLMIATKHSKVVLETAV